MKLTRGADFSIRILSRLAILDKEVTSEELADKIRVPLNHVAKLVQLLARRGYIITKKGKGGGIRLALDPKKIDLAEVIEAVEGPIVISDCILHKSSCCFGKNCRVRTCLDKLRQKMLAVLSATTIYDLMPAN